MTAFTLDQLQALEAIDRRGTFALAAGELGRTPSAVSQSIRALESALDLALFDRSGHRARLTAGGALVLAGARDVLTRAHSLKQLVADLNAGWEPRLGIIVDGSLPLRPVMAALRRFNQEGVPTRVRLQVEYLSGVRARFEADEADVMLTLDWTGDPRFDATALPGLCMRLLIAPDHPLAGLDGPVPRAALQHHAELIVRDSAPDAPVHPRLHIGSPNLVVLSDFHSKRQALTEGVGFGWLPDHLAADAMDSGSLVPLVLDTGYEHMFEPYLVVRGNNRAAALFSRQLRPSAP